MPYNLLKIRRDVVDSLAGIFTALTSSFVKKGSFARTTMLLMSGTALSQIIQFAVAPILTRLYEPAAFGYYATYAAVVAIGGGLITAKYDLALVLPGEENQAADLLRIAVGIVFFFSVVSLVFVQCGKQYVASWMGMQDNPYIVLFIPAGLLLLGLYELYRNWGIRNREFRRITISSVFHVGFTAAVQIFLAFFSGIGVMGLIFGQIAGQMLALVVLLPKQWRKDFRSKNINLRNMLGMAKRYKDFPQYMLLAGLLNRTTPYIPIFVFGWYFPPAVVGFYALSQRVIKAPMSLIGSNISTTFVRKAQDLATRDIAELRKKTFQMSACMIIVGLIPALILYLFAPQLFVIIFGNKWEIAGRYTAVMSFYLLLQFAFTPLAIIFRILEKQRIYTLWEWIRFLLCAFATVTGGIFLNPLGAVTLFSYSMSLSYVVLAVMTYYIFQSSTRLEKRAVRARA